MFVTGDALNAEEVFDEQDVAIRLAAWEDYAHTLEGVTHALHAEVDALHGPNGARCPTCSEEEERQEEQEE